MNPSVNFIEIESKVFGLNLPNLNKFFSFDTDKYIFVANNPNLKGDVFDLVNSMEQACVVHFNKAIHIGLTKSKKSVFFYNGCDPDGLWGFTDSRLDFPEHIDRGEFHFCFDVDVSPFNEANPGLNLISIPIKRDLNKIFSYPSNKTPSIGFLAIMLFSFELIKRGIPPSEKLLLLGFTGSAVLPQHHAVEWEGDFIRMFGFKNLYSNDQLIFSDAGLQEKNRVTNSMSERLIEFYNSMHLNGYKRSDGKFVSPDQSFASFELLRFTDYIDLSIFNNAKVLDYGGGKSDWYKAKINGDLISNAWKFSLVEKYEPAFFDSLKIDKKFDVVVLMDVLEHVYISDVYDVLRTALSLSSGFLVCNVAIYKAMALLPNGQNAHITVRSADWWLGIFEVLSHQFPLIEITLFISHSYNSAKKYVLKASVVQDVDSFEINQPQSLRTISL